MGAMPFSLRCAALRRGARGQEQGVGGGGRCAARVQHAALAQQDPRRAGTKDEGKRGKKSSVLGKIEGA
eukprot:436715-Rhodomonas_salina.1